MSNSNHLSGISVQLQECIKNVQYESQRYKDNPIQELIPKDIRDEYLKINNFPHARKWHALCEGLDKYSLSRREIDLLESNLNRLLHAFKEWEEECRDLASDKGIISVDRVMDMWLFGRIIVPLLQQPGRLLTTVEAFVEMVEEAAELEAEEEIRSQTIEEESQEIEGRSGG
ncbi:hypothetical protein LA080_006023 [Diaporthe eres]|nr:hypothetical protein LA080_006023 [Diaporthe eres]